MALELRKSSKWWYAAFKVDGVRSLVNLQVPITGKRPPKRTMVGDDEFERSRGRAQHAHDEMLRQLEADRTGEKALQKLAELKTGREVTFPRLSDLARHWEEIPRRKPPGGRYATQCKVTFERFARFVADRQPGAQEFVSVKPETAREFMEAEQARGVSPKTWSDTLKLLRATFKHLHPSLSDGSNPFHGLVTKAPETVNREPFSVEELKAILDACADDDFIRPIIVTRMCTAMRRGDCCLLRWKDVDLRQGFLTVKTAKTGQTVDIPIFPMLREELLKAKGRADQSPYCFPDAATMYQNNPDGITWRVKQVLSRALQRAVVRDGKLAPSLSKEDIQARGLRYIDEMASKSRAEKMRAVFLTYLDGKSLDEVIKQTGSSRGTVSNYLNELEHETGCAILRGRRRAPNPSTLQTARENGTRRASVRDFHSFRVSWITLALASGVPLELVQRVTGHRTVAVVMKHYFRPGREDFRHALNQAMPNFLTGGPTPLPENGATSTSAKDQIKAIIERVTPRTWKRDRERILGLLDRL